jgi:hypothetical protein
MLLGMLSNLPEGLFEHVTFLRQEIMTNLLQNTPYQINKQWQVMDLDL